MKKLFIGIACLTSMYASAQNREIVFKEGDWKTQLATAKKENKIIFFDAYTSWCGPCKMMAKDVFTKDEVADMFNGTFHNVKYDMEKGEGPTLREKYEVNAYPTYLFINGDGEVVQKIVGSMSAPEFIKEASKALKPESTVFGLGKKFNDGDHSETTTLAYMDALEKAYEATKLGRVAKIYFDGLPEASLMGKKNWTLAQKYLNNPSSKAFAYLYANKADLEKQYGPNRVNRYFEDTFGSSVYAIKRAYESKSDLEEAKENMTAIRSLLTTPGPFSKSILSKLSLTAYAAANQWDQFAAVVDEAAADKEFPRMKDFVIDAANDVVTLAPASQYTLALNWASKIEKDYPNLFTSIQLADLRKRVFKKQGKTAEAEAMQHKSEELRNKAAGDQKAQPPLLKD
uniref:thioredoxin family protein n=1 Tax=Pedobacter schmidteae TaxID=2201271 RepID=UPI000EB285E6|nr:thioredoxin family protein [Pedobacter schmidteae]